MEEDEDEAKYTEGKLEKTRENDREKKPKGETLYK